MSQFLRLVACPAVPLWALYHSDKTCASNARRLVVCNLTAAAMPLALSVKGVPNPMVAYLVGLLWPWVVLRTFILFWICEPRDQYILRRTAHCTAKDTPAITWQSYNNTSRSTRLLWVVDLFFDFRAINWCYSAKNGNPCEYHRKRVFQSPSSSPTHKSQLFLIFIKMAMRLVFNLTFIDICQTLMFPHFILHLQRLPAIHDGQQAIGRPWCFTVVEIFTTILSSMALIDLVYVVPRLICIGFTMMGLNSFYVGVVTPSPWGSYNSILSHGIAGMLYPAL